MKKAILCAAMCLVVVVAKAQIITKETVYQTYMNAVKSGNSDYNYNAEIEDGAVKAQYIYKKEIKTRRGKPALETLKPYMKHEYEYDAQGRLAARTTLWWSAIYGDWKNAFRLTYDYDDDQCVVEYSQWDKKTFSFNGPTERMVYTMNPDSVTMMVSNYSRKKVNQEFALDYEMTIPAHLPYGDWFLTHNSCP